MRISKFLSKENRSKVFALIMELRNIKGSLSIREKNRVIRSHAKSYSKLLMEHQN